VRNLSVTTWTISSIKEYFERRFEDLEKLTNLERKLHQLALDVAKAESDHRLEGMNEFREENRRNMSVTVTQDKFYSEIGNILKEMKELQTWKASVTGSNSRANTLSIIAITLTLLVAVVEIILRFYKP
jgi:beta-phosphoglucomutase-like phosphatase (HAD superfamily)